MRERRFKTHPHRFGEGKVHRYLYSRENRVWYVACSEPYKDPHGKRTDDDAEVTCKRCLPSRSR